jgi:hypothetical protein
LGGRAVSVQWIGFIVSWRWLSIADQWILRVFIGPFSSHIYIDHAVSPDTEIITSNQNGPGAGMFVFDRIQNSVAITRGVRVEQGRRIVDLSHLCSNESEQLELNGDPDGQRLNSIE